ncbi:BamA/TamA family outer membrane protein, partial [Fodinibius sp.]|uniref:Omp85 family outer membrane protein n=1 Tax=Fodinibius sp. TaxID=1872440 RepID=UPI0035680124
ADMGLQLGALGQVFFYGDGSSWPRYKHTVYAEVSRFTKGSGVNQLFYDSKYLLPGDIRVTADITYLTERALDFYGFNGYQAAYHPGFEEEGSGDYISRVFYRHERKLLRILADLQGRITSDRFRWLAGIHVVDIKTSSVDIEKINRGKPEDKQLPDVPTLYDEYVSYGLIGNEEKAGGTTVYLKTGLVFDTRDNEPAPEHGIWSEVLFLTAPSFLGNRAFTFNKLAVIHRHYIPLVRKRLVFAYRLGYQGTVGGTAPFYIQPYIYNSFSLTTRPDGLGGGKTLRGVLRNRVVGDGMVYGNVELRWVFLITRLLGQEFLIGLHGFADAGQTIKEIAIDRSLVPAGQHDRYFDQERDGLHTSLGMGLRFTLDRNFILAVDYGVATDPRDGTGGLYISVGNVF